MASAAAAALEWPRAFRMTENTGPVGPKFWTHNLYQGPDKRAVKISYSRTKIESEEIAQEFLSETVVGFDMEWPFGHSKEEEKTLSLQQRIGLIQIASENHIALFHIGMHTGITPIDILAPSLRKIIESDDITKTGVGILNADFVRLHQWFGLQPRGAFELSHLHNLVTYGAEDSVKVTTRMRALAKQVEEHLGLPLFKGKVRTSNWSKPLTPAQIQYAAADAYASLMLYHCMNAKRLSADPVPPMPLHAETYMPMTPGMGSIIPVRLGLVSKATSGVSAIEFYQQALGIGNPAQPMPGRTISPAEARRAKGMESEEGEDWGEEQQEAVEDALSLVTEAVAVPRRRVLSKFEGEVLASIQKEMVPFERKIQDSVQKETKAARGPKPASVQARTPTSAIAITIFDKLRAHRTRVAQQQGFPAYVVAINTVLTAIAEARPQNDQELREIFGISEAKAKQYGPAWLAIVREVLEEQGEPSLEEQQAFAPPAPRPATPNPRRSQPRPATDTLSNEPTRTPAILHTGLSFCMSTANLEADAGPEVIVISDDSGDGDSAFGSPIESPSPSTLKRKRDLLDSSVRNQPNQQPGLPRSQFQFERAVAKAVNDALQIQPQPTATHAVQELLRIQAPSAALISGPRGAMPPPSTETKRSAPARPQPAAPQPIPPPQVAALLSDPSSLNAKILRSKLLAFNRRVTSVEVMSEATIQQIIEKRPQTAQELLQIPNIIPFANICARQNQCLLSFIKKQTEQTAVTGS